MGYGMDEEVDGDVCPCGTSTFGSRYCSAECTELYSEAPQRGDPKRGRHVVTSQPVRQTVALKVAPQPQNPPRHPPPTIPCPNCQRKFGNAASLHQHHKASHPTLPLPS